jgi:hypothetical protein
MDIVVTSSLSREVTDEDCGGCDSADVAFEFGFG